MVRKGANVVLNDKIKAEGTGTGFPPLTLFLGKKRIERCVYLHNWREAKLAALVKKPKSPTTDSNSKVPTVQPSDGEAWPQHDQGPGTPQHNHTQGPVPVSGEWPPMREKTAYGYQYPAGGAQDWSYSIGMEYIGPRSSYYAGPQPTSVPYTKETHATNSHRGQFLYQRGQFNTRDSYYQGSVEIHEPGEESESEGRNSGRRQGVINVREHGLNTDASRHRWGCWLFKDR